MSENQCVRCGRPTADGYACTGCTGRAAAQLAEIADLAPIVWDIAHGLSRSQGSAGGAGAPGPRFPLDLTSGAKLDATANALGTWVRHVTEERGVFPERVPPGFPVTAVSARFLAEHLEWMRHRPEADEFLTDVEASLRVMRSVARGPVEQKYLGLCGAPVEVKAEIPMLGTVEYPTTCEGDVYGRPEADKGRCKTCGATVAQAERRAWLDSEVRQHSYTAAEIADAYGLKANTIRQWLSRGLLVAHGELHGRPLLNLGEVLDLAAGDAARREEARAERARRREGATA